MIDITSTSFGLLIANVLPGLVTLFGLSYFLPELRRLFDTFLNGESNLGLFLLVALMSITASLLVTLVRWYIFELHLCRKIHLNPDDFDGLSGTGKITAFRAAVDEHYRYHQFFGSMTIALPVLFLGWALGNSIFDETWTGIVSTTIFLLLEILTFYAAYMGYVSYVERSKHIMKGV
jgi:hypothetical protein